MIAKTWDPLAGWGRRLLSVGIYYQEAGCHPLYDRIGEGLERLELVTQGRGWVRIEGKIAEVTAGALLWHRAGDETVSRSDFENPYRCLSVHIETLAPPGERVVPQLTWWPDLEEVRRFASEVVRARADERFDGGVLLAYLQSRLLFQARQWQLTQGREALPPKLRRALDLLEEGPVAVARVADEVGWSVAHLHEVFRQRLGVTPYEAALRRRMQVARERLAATDQSVKQIAADCGFASAAAFCHAFKARVGVTPLAYRHHEAGVRAAR